jgi:hypothetical protein
MRNPLPGNRWPRSRPVSKLRIMVDSQIHNELVRQLELLPVPMQRRVLDFARGLSATPTSPKGTPGRAWRRFMGTISPEDGRAMIEAIEEGCEQVDANEW